MKNKKRYTCKECGYSSATWLGKCPECLSWNSFIEEIIIDKSLNKNIISDKERKLLNISEIKFDNNDKIKINNNELNDFFGDGLVLGSVTLLTGEPGVGKSTLLLNISKYLSKDIKIFYFSGEESQEQLKRRCNRIKINNSNLFISNESGIEKIIKECKKENPDLIFIDSIQTSFSSDIDSSVGTISQIRYCTSQLIQFAKDNEVTVIIVGHVTKSGDIAGPKLMEHMVDTVVEFTSDNQYQFRILRSVKNRFGSTDEIVIFEMKENGLAVVDNPVGFFIDNDEIENITGRCRTVIIEGRRPLIIEVEALVVPSVYSNPRRFSEGVDTGRISRIAAIIDKHLNENLNNYDIYFNITGGIKTKDVGIDLAIALAIYSSKNNTKINKDVFLFGELSLTGKIRNVNRLDIRIKESKKFGANRILLPKNSLNLENDIEIVHNIGEVINSLFKKI